MAGRTPIRVAAGAALLVVRFPATVTVLVTLTLTDVPVPVTAVGVPVTLTTNPDITGRAKIVVAGAVPNAPRTDVLVPSATAVKIGLVLAFAAAVALTGTGAVAETTLLPTKSSALTPLTNVPVGFVPHAAMLAVSTLAPSDSLKKNGLVLVFAAVV